MEIYWSGRLISVFVGFAALSIVIGYPIALGLISSIILERKGIRKVKESMIWFGNSALVEHDIRTLANQGDEAAIKVLRVLRYCKVSISVNILLIALTAIFSAEVDRFIKKFY